MKSKLILFFILYSIHCYSQNLNKEKFIANEVQVNIPVLFHIIYNDSTDLNKYNNTLFEKFIDSLNNGFNQKANFSLISKAFVKDIANCNIKFNLPYEDKNGKQISPISWHKTNRMHYYVNSNDIKQLKSYGYKDSDTYLNIWVCNIADTTEDGKPVWGFVPRQLRFTNIDNLKDGVVLDYNSFISKFTIIHEVGHWLGLAHIWGDSMIENTFGHNCLDDDGIKDTPRQKGPNFSGEEIQNECFGKGKTNYQNYMDYYYEVGMFTYGQRYSMREFLYERRRSMIEETLTIETPNSSDDFLIGEWEGDVTTYIFRSDKKYIIKQNNTRNSSSLPPTPYEIWSLNGDKLTLKQQYRSTLPYRIKIISKDTIELYGANGGLFGVFNRVKRTGSTPTLYSRGGYPIKQKTQSNNNVKKLNGRSNNKNTQQKKKTTTLKDLLKKQN